MSSIAAEAAGITENPVILDEAIEVASPGQTTSVHNTDIQSADTSESEPKVVKETVVALDTTSLPSPPSPQPAPSSKLSWRPLTLYPISLLVLVLFQAGVLGAVEVLYRYSNANNGLLTVTDHDSAAKIFAWSYLPIAIALAIALWWAQIDMDICRTDPWVELSNPGGVGSMSVFKNDFGNPFTAPAISLWRLFRKTKSRLCSSIILCSALGHLIAFFILPPLQASLMSKLNIMASDQASFIQMPGFNSSSPIILNNHLFEWFLKAFLNYHGLLVAESVWISNGVAVLPSTPKDGNFQGATWEATTTAYTAHLRCELTNASELIYIDAAKASQLSQTNAMPGKTRINFLDLQYPISAIFSGLGDDGGCEFRIDVPLAQGNDPTGRQSDEWYYGGWGRLSPSTSLSNTSIDMSCDHYQYLGVNYATLDYSPSDNKPSFDYDVVFGVEPSFNAAVCQSTYEMVPGLKVNFTNSVSSTTFNFSLDDFNQLVSPIASSAFNSTEFEEYLLMDTASFNKDNSSYPTTNSSGQPTTIQTDFVPYSFYFSSFEYSNIELYLDTTNLSEWTELFLQAAFVQRIDLAAESWASKPVDKLEYVATLLAERVLVNVGYARATESILALLILLTILMAVLGWNRKTKLRSDPSTVAAKLSLVCNSTELLEELRKQDPENNRLAGGGRYSLKEREDGEMRLTLLESGVEQNPVTRKYRKYHISVLKQKAAFLICLALFAITILVVIIVLWAIAQNNSGLSPGSFYIRINSVNQFAWTIVPVVAIILVKFFWSQIDDYFRLMQPYITLIKGPVGPEASICVNYETIFIGWVSIKALVRKHYILSAITLLSLANEVLVVGMGALFTTTTLPVVQDQMFLGNTTIRTDFTNLTNVPSDYEEIANLVVQLVGDNQASYPDLAEIALNIGGKPAPWTTLEYAFLPVYLNETVDNIEGYPQNINWTVTTIGVRGLANCRSIDYPSALFDNIGVDGTENSTGGPIYGYELHEWWNGSETTRNTITLNQSVLRIPSSVAGPGVRQAVQVGTLIGVLNYTGFWGPFWRANIDDNGNITFANISLPGPVQDNFNNTRDIQTLPEMEQNIFGAGWIDFQRVQAPNTSLWYSPAPAAAFVACVPTFEWVRANVILDAGSQEVLAYDVQGQPNTINGSEILETWYDSDGTTRALTGLGTLFTILSIFQTGNPLWDHWNELNFFGDQSSLMTSAEVADLSDLTQPGNLGPAVERAFTALFSQYVALPGLVFEAADETVEVVGGLMVSQTRIIMSRTAFVIVVTILSMEIIALLALVYLMYRLRGTLPQLSHELDTIGAVLCLIRDSKNLLSQFRETVGMTPQERDAYLRSLKTHYKLGRFSNGSDSSCFGIEVEELAEWVSRTPTANGKRGGVLRSLKRWLGNIR